jgi:hypothetical protein
VKCWDNARKSPGGKAQAVSQRMGVISLLIIALAFGAQICERAEHDQSEGVLLGNEGEAQ